MAELVGKAKYHVERTVLWGFTPKDDPTRFQRTGVWYELSIEPSISRDTEWQLIRLPDGPANEPYKVKRYHFLARGIRHLEVYVDLTMDSVVSIAPGPEAKLKVPAKDRDDFYGHHRSD